jgi:hypothetical protein
MLFRVFAMNIGLPELVVLAGVVVLVWILMRSRGKQ